VLSGHDFGPAATAANEASTIATVGNF